MLTIINLLHLWTSFYASNVLSLNEETYHRNDEPNKPHIQKQLLQNNEEKESKRRGEENWRMGWWTVQAMIRIRMNLQVVLQIVKTALVVAEILVSSLLISFLESTWLLQCRRIRLCGLSKSKLQYTFAGLLLDLFTGSPNLTLFFVHLLFLYRTFIFYFGYTSWDVICQRGREHFDHGKYLSLLFTPSHSR